VNGPTMMDEKDVFENELSINAHTHGRIPKRDDNPTLIYDSANLIFHGIEGRLDFTSIELHALPVTIWRIKDYGIELFTLPISTKLQSIKMIVGKSIFSYVIPYLIDTQLCLTSKEIETPPKTIHFDPVSYTPGREGVSMDGCLEVCESH